MSDRVRTKLVEQLDQWFSKYIRLRDSDAHGRFVCVSCARVLPIHIADCGHYIPREHMATRYMEQNCHAQCVDCNRIQSGNMTQYRNRLVMMYGSEYVNELDRKKYVTEKISNYELEALLDHYKRKVKELRNQKPNVKI